MTHDSTPYRMLMARMLEPGLETVIVCLPEATVRGTVAHVERDWTERVRVRFTSGAELTLHESAMVGLVAPGVDVRANGEMDLPASAPGPGDTIPEGVEYLGSYKSIADYMRAMLEPEVTPGCAWILDHLDYRVLQRRWESDGSRLMIERGHVYRLAVSGPEGDPTGP